MVAVQPLCPRGSSTHPEPQPIKLPTCTLADMCVKGREARLSHQNACITTHKHCKCTQHRTCTLADMCVKMGVSTSSVSMTTMPVTKLARGVLALHSVWKDYNSRACEHLRTTSPCAHTRRAAYVAPWSKVFFSTLSSSPSRVVDRGAREGAGGCVAADVGWQYARGWGGPGPPEWQSA